MIRTFPIPILMAIFASCSSPSLPAAPPSSGLANSAGVTPSPTAGAPKPETLTHAAASIGSDADKKLVSECIAKGFIYRRSDTDTGLKEACKVAEGIGCSTTEKVANLAWTMDGILQGANIPAAFQEETKKGIKDNLDAGFSIDQVSIFDYKTCSYDKGPQVSRYRIYFVKETTDVGVTRVEIRYLRIL